MDSDRPAKTLSASAGASARQRKENLTPARPRQSFTKPRKQVFADFGVQVFAPLPRAISPERELPKPATPAEVLCLLVIVHLALPVCVMHWYFAKIEGSTVCLLMLIDCAALFVVITLCGWYLLIEVAPTLSFLAFRQFVLLLHCSSLQHELVPCSRQIYSFAPKSGANLALIGLQFIPVVDCNWGMIYMRCIQAQSNTASLLFRPFVGH